MVPIPNNPGDLGYYDISMYTMEYMLLLESNLSIKFLDTSNTKQGFIINLEKIIAYNNWMKNNQYVLLRVDNDGSTFGFDIAIRLKQPNLQKYMVLYIFEDAMHTSFVFRGLAEKISIAYF